MACELSSSVDQFLRTRNRALRFAKVTDYFGVRRAWQGLPVLDEERAGLQAYSATSESGHWTTLALSSSQYESSAKPAGRNSDCTNLAGRITMKYLGAWILGVPTGLILLWFVFNHVH